MFDTIILLTGLPQQQVALGALLRAHNPQIALRGAVTLDDLLAIDPATLRRARLLAFTTGVIVPAHVLNALGYGAYNFHPGSPDYPGWAPAHFALYERATTFGATAHLMHAQVDCGPIIGTESFAVPDGIAVRELEQIAFVRLAYLFWRLAKELATRAAPPPVLPVAWSGRKSTKKSYRAACAIPADISAEDLALRVRAFQDDFRGVPLTVTLHGLRFELAADPVVPMPQACAATERSATATAPPTAPEQPARATAA
ncbi:MAG: formyltransferase family protein [Pseudomonadota bacterium]|jgi:methionyl-tRNA formyltransferase